MQDEMLVSLSKVRMIRSNYTTIPNGASRCMISAPEDHLFEIEYESAETFLSPG